MDLHAAASAAAEPFERTRDKTFHASLSLYISNENMAKAGISLL